MSITELREPIRSRLDLGDKQTVVTVIRAIAKHGDMFLGNVEELREAASEYFKTNSVRLLKRQQLLEGIETGLRSAAEFHTRQSHDDVENARQVCDFLAKAYGGLAIFNSRDWSKDDSREKRKNEALTRMNGTLDWHMLDGAYGFLEKCGLGFMASPLARELEPGIPETIREEICKVDIKQGKSSSIFSEGYAAVKKAVGIVDDQDELAVAWDRAHAPITAGGERWQPKPLVDLPPAGSGGKQAGAGDPFGLKSGGPLSAGVSTYLGDISRFQGRV